MATDVGFLNKIGSRPFSVEFFRIKHELRQARWSLAEVGAVQETEIRERGRLSPFATLRRRLWPAGGSFKLNFLRRANERREYFAYSRVESVAKHPLSSVRPQLCLS
jgi:hypothetical protein